MKKKSKKSHNAGKKLKGDGFHLGFFNIHSVKKIPEKSLAMPKKRKRGTLWSRPVLHVTREKNEFQKIPTLSVVKLT